MWLVHRREKCHSLKKLISGVVLMGVPHCTSDSRRGCLYKVSAYILQAHSKLNASTIARLQASSDSSLFNICEQYDEIVSQDLSERFSLRLVKAGGHLLALPHNSSPSASGRHEQEH